MHSQISSGGILVVINISEVVSRWRYLVGWRKQDGFIIMTVCENDRWCTAAGELNYGYCYECY